MTKVHRLFKKATTVVTEINIWRVYLFSKFSYR